MGVFMSRGTIKDKNHQHWWHSTKDRWNYNIPRILSM